MKLVITILVFKLNQISRNIYLSVYLSVYQTIRGFRGTGGGTIRGFGFRVDGTGTETVQAPDTELPAEQNPGQVRHFQHLQSGK